MFSPNEKKYKPAGIIIETPDNITPAILWLNEKININIFNNIFAFWVCFS